MLYINLCNCFIILSNSIDKQKKYDTILYDNTYYKIIIINGGKK